MAEVTVVKRVDRIFDSRCLKRNRYDGEHETGTG